MKSFLVTGATGDTGRHTTALLLERGHRVRALVHREDARSEALQKQGAEVMVGDLLDFSRMREAVQGMDGAYFVFPLAPGIVQASAFFAQAAREAKVDAIVNMSQIVARPDAASHASLNHWIAERVFDWSGLGVTHLRPGFFAEWLTYSAAQTGATGTLALPLRDDVKIALVAAEDQARVIAAILENPEKHRGQTYPLYGAVELTFPEIAREMSQALGREIRYQPVEIGMFTQAMRGAGRNEFVLQHVSEGGAVDFANGLFTGRNDLVESIGGRKPLTVREYVTRHAAAFEPSGREDELTGSARVTPAITFTPVACTTKEPRSPCPMAASLDVFGDRWTLLVVRDLFGGPRRFKDLMASIGGIPTNVLSARLARLLEQGVIVHVEAPGGGKHQAYRLTGKGEALLPIIVAIHHWLTAN